MVITWASMNINNKMDFHCTKSPSLGPHFNFINAFSVKIQNSCHLFSAKQLLEQTLTGILRTHLDEIWIKIQTVFLQQNVFRDVFCEIVIISSGISSVGRWIAQGSHPAGIFWVWAPANKMMRYYVTPSLIGRAHTQNDPLLCIHR